VEESLVSMNCELKRLYQEDFEEHSLVPMPGTREYSDLRSRDLKRRESAKRILGEIEDPAPSDYYHVAWLLNHGDVPDDARLAHELATRAAEAGYQEAVWLSAASYDRWCMYRGLMQKFGTQIVPDGNEFRVWDVEPDTTDEERARFGVPPIVEMHARAARLSVIAPQPDLKFAPKWLLGAIERWQLSTENG
jgi:hypothetical protein